MRRSSQGQVGSHARSVTCFASSALALNTYWQAVISIHTHTERATVTGPLCPGCCCCAVAVVAVDLMVLLCTLLPRPAFPFSPLPAGGPRRDKAVSKSCCSCLFTTIIYVYFLDVPVLNAAIMFRRERGGTSESHCSFRMFFTHHVLLNNKFHSFCSYSGLTLKCTDNGVYGSWGVFLRPPTGLCWLTWCHPSWTGGIAQSEKNLPISKQKKQKPSAAVSTVQND